MIRHLLARLVHALTPPPTPVGYIRQTVDPHRETPGGYGLKIVCLDVNHGDATLIIFPSGRVALIDSAKDEWCERRVIPFLQNHRIGEITYYINTHLHDDHVGQRERLIRDFLVKEVWDYRSFHTGEERDFEDMRLTILNSYEDATDENDRSLVFRLDYHGFIYTHGADIYAEGQQRIMERFPQLLRSHVYRANHHLHGSVSQEYLIQTDPYLLVISAEETIYQRIAYTHDFCAAVRRIKATPGRLQDIYLTLEKGNVVIFANSDHNWGYSSYAPQIILSQLYP
jgi:beta-lactamase superfamily II metal-dependent hydrolase